MASADLIRESQDPTTSATRLAELAQLDRDLWPAIAVHPTAYPALLDWLGQQGDPTVNAVLALRAGSSVATPTTTPPPPPQPTEATTAYTAVPPGNSQAASPLSATGSDNNKSPWLLAGLVAIALVLIAGAAFGITKAFGGDDDKDEASSSQTVEAPELSAVPTVGVPDTDSEGDSDSATVAFCEKFKEAQVALRGNPSSTPGSATVKAIAEVFGDLQELAPAEIVADIEVMADYFETMSDPSKLDTSTISERVKTFTASGKRVSTYYASTCM